MVQAKWNVEGSNGNSTGLRETQFVPTYEANTDDDDFFQLFGGT